MTTEQLVNQDPQALPQIKQQVAKLYNLNPDNITIQIKDNTVIVKDKMSKPNILQVIIALAGSLELSQIPSTPLEETDYNKIRNLKNKGGYLQQHNVIKHNVGRNQPCHCGSGIKRKLCCKHQNPKQKVA